MRNCWAIYRREMQSLFISPIAYVVLVAFAVLGGWFFYSICAYFNLISVQSMQNPYMTGGLNLTQGVARPLFHNLSVILLFLMPLVTMRLLAEEKKSGTIELLFTYPVRDAEAVLAKFGAALTVLAAMLALSLVYVLLMAVIGDPEPGPLVAMYLGVFLMGAAFLALGLWVSSLTENQIVAGAVSFGALLFFYVLGWAASFAGEGLGKLTNQLSLLDHIENFTKGVIDTADVTYYLVFAAFFLFLTLRSLESRRWRG